jgi:putative endonuclease
MDRRKETGSLGEQLAVEHLEAKGWEILDRNWRCPAGELDIIARDTAGYLVFCEVKTRRRYRELPVPPLEAITVKKLYKLQELGMRWLRAARRQYHLSIRGVRYDGIGVVLGEHSEPVIQHQRGLGF